MAVGPQSSGHLEDSGAGGRDRSGGPQRHRSGTVASAWSHKAFRRVFLGMFASSVGTWMQNVVVGPFALLLSRSDRHPLGSASFVGTISLAQFGPVLVLSVVGGAIANRLPRKRTLIVSQVVQMCCALGLAAMAYFHPSRLGLFLGVLGGGLSNALAGPTFQAIMPGFVPREDMPGLIALNSAQLNGSRVVGPVLMAILAPLGVGAFSAHGAAAAFLINAVTFLFSIQAIARSRIVPAPPRSADEPTGFAQLLVGFRRAKASAVAGPMLLMLFVFTACCLPYVGQFPTISERAFDIGSRTRMYTLLFATWGMGACLGALSIATVFAQVDKRRSIRFVLFAFAVALAMFSAARSPVTAFPSAFLLGFCYFATTTSMSTVLQQHLDDRERGPVLALWMMAFGGTIPLGAKVGGFVIDHWSPRPLLLGGAAVALVLGCFGDFVQRSERHRALRATART